MKEAEKNNTKAKKFNIRMILVILFILIYLTVNFFNIRGEYLYNQEIGPQYVEKFMQSLEYNAIIFAINFVLIFLLFYIVTIFIKKGLRKLLAEEKIDMPKLPNKSLALVISAIITIIFVPEASSKIILAINATSFEITDPIFNIDIAYYIFNQPVIEMFLKYIIFIGITLLLYIGIYFIVSLNIYSNGIDLQSLKKNTIIKIVITIFIIIAISIASLVFIKSTDVLFTNFFNLNDEFSLVGAGATDILLKVWGFRLLSIIIVLSVLLIIRYLKKGNKRKAFKSVLIVPIYLIVLFVLMIGYQYLVVHRNQLDTEYDYIKYNIDSTKNAYNIKLEEKELGYSGTVTYEEVQKNEEILRNIPVVDENATLTTLTEYQNKQGNYVFNNTKLLEYNEDLVYVTPREIINSEVASKNKEDKYGYGAIITSATRLNEDAGIEYLQSDFVNAGKKEFINISEPKIYFGLESNEANRNILNIVKNILPDIIYDENPYLVITDEGRLVWIIDGYTVTDKYPYSNSTTITVEGTKKTINYIRNSVKVLVDACDGTVSYYITDRNDPIIMAYRNIYPSIFKDLNEELPTDIKEHITYPEFLYNIQSQMLNIYHNTEPEVLYRNDDIWEIATYQFSAVTNKVTQMSPNYTMIATISGNGKIENKLGLVLPYTLDGRQNLNAYLVGYYDENSNENKLVLNKFISDNGVLGPKQLERQINEDTEISKKIEEISLAGSKIVKNLYVIPIANTILYVEPIYQVLVNESPVPLLKKVIVSSGNKLAIGDTLQEALENLLSQYAVSIEVQDSDDIEAVIESIIKANNNLKSSSKSNNWSLMGQDIEKLQELIEKLEELTTGTEDFVNFVSEDVEN